MANIKPQDQNPFDEDGLRHGEWIRYFSNGQLDHRWNYFHGVEHGFFEGYYSSGKLAYHGHYNMEKQVGYWYLYNEKRYYLCLI